MPPSTARDPPHIHWHTLYRMGHVSLSLSLSLIHTHTHSLSLAHTVSHGTWLAHNPRMSDPQRIHRRERPTDRSKPREASPPDGCAAGVSPGALPVLFGSVWFGCSVLFYCSIVLLFCLVMLFCSIVLLFCLVMLFCSIVLLFCLVMLFCSIVYCSVWLCCSV